MSSTPHLLPVLLACGMHFRVVSLVTTRSSRFTNFVEVRHFGSARTFRLHTLTPLLLLPCLRHHCRCPPAVQELQNCVPAIRWSLFHSVCGCQCAFRAAVGGGGVQGGKLLEFGGLNKWPCCACVPFPASCAQDNDLSYLEGIHLFVELLDRYFGNVTELDLVYNFHKVYVILDEYILAGEIQETSQAVMLDRLQALERAWYVHVWGPSLCSVPVFRVVASLTNHMRGL